MCASSPFLMQVKHLQRSFFVHELITVDVIARQVTSSVNIHQVTGTVTVHVLILEEGTFIAAEPVSDFLLLSNLVYFHAIEVKYFPVLRELESIILLSIKQRFTVE